MHPSSNTPPPTGAASRFLVTHWRIGRSFHDYLGPLLDARYGLGLKDFLVLATIDRGVQYPTELAERLKLPKDMTSRTLQTLVKANLVERAIDAHDSRRTRLTTTPAGRSLHADVLREMEGLLEPLLAQLGEGQKPFLTALETLSDLLTAPPEPVPTGEK